MLAEQDKIYINTETGNPVFVIVGLFFYLIFTFYLFNLTSSGYAIATTLIILSFLRIIFYKNMRKKIIASGVEEYILDKHKNSKVAYYSKHFIKKTFSDSSFIFLFTVSVTEISNTIMWWECMFFCITLVIIFSIFESQNRLELEKSLSFKKEKNAS
jgi:hypothetical protein